MARSSTACWVGFRGILGRLAASLVLPEFWQRFATELREGLSRFLTQYYLIPLGIIFTLMVIFLPQGLLRFLRRRLNQ